MKGACDRVNRKRGNRTNSRPIAELAGDGWDSDGGADSAAVLAPLGYAASLASATVSPGRITAATIRSGEEGARREPSTGGALTPMLTDAPPEALE